MNVRHPRRLCVLAVFAALAAQMALPAVHSRSVARSAHVSATDLQPLPATGLVLTRSALPEAAHDRDSCPVCQSLLHASPAALASVALDPAPGLEVLPPTSAPQPFADALHTGHPPRGPPLLPASLSI